MNEKYAYVMMIQDKWWQEFCRNNLSGRQIHSYVRRGSAPPAMTSLLLFYVVKPAGQMAGYAEFIERQVGNPDELWVKYGRESVLETKEKYEEFIGPRRKVSFIRFMKLRRASEPVELSALLLHLNKKRLARKGFYVDRETAEKLIAFMN